MKGNWLKRCAFAIGIISCALLSYAFCSYITEKVDGVPRAEWTWAYFKSFLAYKRDEVTIDKMLSKEALRIHYSINTEGRFEIPVRIHYGSGSKVLNCIFDTGAQDVTLVHPIAYALPMVVGKTKTCWLSGPADSSLVRVPQLDLGSITFHDTLATVSTFPSCEHSPFFGMIGDSVLDHFVVTVDNAAKVLILTNPRNYRVPSAAIVVPFANRDPWIPVYSANFPVIECKVGGRRAILLVDSGASESSIHACYLHKFSDVDSPLTFGSVALPHFGFGEQTSDYFNDVDGLLGTDFIRAFKTFTFDFRSNRLILEPYADEPSTYAEIELVKAHRHLMANKLALADSELTNLINSGSTDFRAFVNRARTKKNPDDAIRDYTRAIALCGLYPAAYEERAERYADKEDFEKALTDINKAIELYTADPASKRSDLGWEARPYMLRVYLYGISGKYQQAIDDCSTALAINPKLPFVSYARDLILNYVRNTKPSEKKGNSSAGSNLSQSH